LTETHATTTPGAPVFPPGRYGRRRAPHRRRPWVVALLLVAVIAAGAALAARLYQQYGPAYDAQVTAYAEITDSHVVMKFQVTVPKGGEAICVLRARSRDGVEVGKAEVRVAAAPGETRAISTYRLPTTARPIIGEAVRCRAAE
jgi:hypothetical protein